VPDHDVYPFCLPFLRNGFDLSFDRSITIIAGENGTGKSTLLEGIAVLAGYDEAGGGKGYMPVDHTNAIEVMGGELLFGCALSRPNGPGLNVRSSGLSLVFARRRLLAIF
jgi:predicted ATPase